MAMRAIQWDADKGKVELLQLEKPRISEPDDVIIKVRYSGICGTDLHIIQGEFPAAKKVILGHELSGVVVEVGTDVAHVAPGDAVGVDVSTFCHDCRYCLSGNTNLCLTGSVWNYNGIFRDGGWADFCLIKSSQAIKMPKGMSFQHSALCEPMGCIVNSMERYGPIKDSTKVLIAGFGIIGALHASTLYYKGCRNIHVVEPMAGRRDYARKMGIATKIYTPQELLQEYKKLVITEVGMDVIVDCTGSPQAFEDYFPLLCKGSTYCMFGCCPSGAKATICPLDFMMKECKVTGSFAGGKHVHTEAIPLMSNMAESGRMELANLGVKQFELEDYEKALEELSRGEITKAMLRLSDE